MHNGVYQYEVWYAIFTPDQPISIGDTPDVDIDALIGFDPDQVSDDWDFIHTEPVEEAPQPEKPTSGG